MGLFSRPYCSALLLDFRCSIHLLITQRVAKRPCSVLPFSTRAQRFTQGAQLIGHRVLAANQFEILGGEQGLLFDVGFPPLSLGEEFTQYKWFFWIASLATLIAIFWLQNVMRSRYGRTWKAIRGSEVAAELAGVNIARAKILAFTLSAGLAGLAGALLAMTIGTVSPSAFPLALSFSLLTGAVLSGVTTLGGVMIGAVTLVALPEIVGTVVNRAGASEAIATNLPHIVMGTLLILTVVFVPNGPVEQMRSRRVKKEKSL